MPSFDVEALELAPITLGASVCIGSGAAAPPPSISRLQPPPDPLLDRRAGALNCTALQGRLQPLALAQIFVSARPFQPPSAPEADEQCAAEVGCWIYSSRQS